MNADQEEVLIKAPLGAVPAMLEARERWLRGETESARTTTDSTAVVKGNVWRRSQLRHLHEALPYEAVRVLFDLLAAHPGEWVAKADAEAAAGVSPRQLANELSALSKWSRRNFGPDAENKPKWPIEFRKLNNQFSYRMSPEIAAMWSNQ